MQGKGLLIVGCHQSRRFWFEAARERGLRVYTIKGNPTWEWEYCDDIVDMTPRYYDQIEAIVEATLAMAGRHQIDGIVTPFCPSLPVLGAAGRALGLQTITPETVRTVLNKSLLRSRFAEAGIPSAQAISVSSAAEARRAAGDIGLPVIVKPATGTGSIGVSLVTAMDDVASAFEVAVGASSTLSVQAQVIVEEYLDGAECSVEAVIFRGEILFETVTAKPQPMEGPFFAELEFASPANYPSEVTEQIFMINRQVLQALDIKDGVTHTEMRLTSRGPRLLEINPRVAGQRLPQIILEAQGVDLIGAAIDIAMGVRPQIHARHNLFVGYRCIHPHKAGTLREINHVDEARRVPGISSIEIVIPPGSHVDVLPKAIQENVAYIFARSESYDAMRAATLQAEKMLDLVVE